MDKETKMVISVNSKVFLSFSSEIRQTSDNIDRLKRSMSEIGGANLEFIIMNTF